MIIRLDNEQMTQLINRQKSIHIGNKDKRRWLKGTRIEFLQGKSSRRKDCKLHGVVEEISIMRLEYVNYCFPFKYSIPVCQQKEVLIEIDGVPLAGKEFLDFITQAGYRNKYQFFNDFNEDCRELVLYFRIEGDYSDLTRFPIRETVCDFSALDKLKASSVSLVLLRTIGCNVQVYYDKKNYLQFSNCDLFRINAPYFRKMKKFKNVIIDYLTLNGIAYQELLF